VTFQGVMVAVSRSNACMAQARIVSASFVGSGLAQTFAPKVQAQSFIVFVSAPPRFAEGTAHSSHAAHASSVSVIQPWSKTTALVMYHSIYGPHIFVEGAVVPEEPTGER